MVVTRINEFVAADGKSKELDEFLSSLIPFISGSEGWISCQVLTGLEDSQKFIVVEQWQSVEDHKKSLEKFPKDEMQAAMSLFGAPPKGDYYKD